jgi:uncharacterized small protein (DUF1192 family)
LCPEVALDGRIHQLLARMGATGSTLEALSRVREERVGALRAEIARREASHAEEQHALDVAESQLIEATNDQRSLASSPSGPVRVAELTLLDGRRAKALERVAAIRRDVDLRRLRAERSSIEIVALQGELLHAVGELKAVDIARDRLAIEARAAVERSEEERAEELAAARSFT